jgi:hypothetical protein
MNTPAKKSDYMLLFRGTDWQNTLAPEQTEQARTDWYAWFERLMQEGKCTGGHPLLTEGKLISGKHGLTILDGPFAESKEAIGGYFYLQVADENEAIQIAQQCPGLEYGCVVEVRPVGERCPANRRGSEHATHAE